jgi:hypothetical protein
LEEKEDKNLRIAVQYGKLSSQEKMKEPQEVLGRTEDLGSQEKLDEKPVI